VPPGLLVWCLVGSGFGSSSRRRDWVRHDVWDHLRLRGSCLWCCSVPRLGDLAWCRCSFESVNQVLVRLWARLAAATDRMVGGPLSGGLLASCSRAMCSEARIMC